MSLHEPLARNQLVIHSKDEFQRAGFTISDENIKSNSFDFIAKKTGYSDISSLSIKSQKIITKVLVDLDLFSRASIIKICNKFASMINEVWYFKKGGIKRKIGKYSFGARKKIGKLHLEPSKNLYSFDHSNEFFEKNPLWR